MEKRLSFNFRLSSRFLEKNIDYNIDELYKYLDSNPEIVKINSHLTLKYKTDVKLIETLNKYTKINKGN